MRLYRANYSLVARDGRVKLARLNKALVECRSAGGQHE